MGKIENVRIHENFPQRRLRKNNERLRFIKWNRNHSFLFLERFRKNNNNKKFMNPTSPPAKFGYEIHI